MADSEAPISDPISQNAQLNLPQSSEPIPSQSTTTTLGNPLPNMSFADNGDAKKPRDTRLIHMILASNGVASYQSRLPLQLLDFAYRYTSSTLQDALHLTSEGYGTAAPSGGGKSVAANDLSAITFQSLRLSIASRTHYQFSPSMPKDYYLEQAQERNRVALPAVGRDWGVRMPPEQYCLTGGGWTLKEEWDEVEGDDDGTVLGLMEVDREINGGDEEEDANAEEDGNERMEDIFGDGSGGDRDMEDS